LRRRVVRLLKEVIGVERERAVSTDQANENIQLLEDFLSCTSKERQPMPPSIILLQSKISQKRFDLEQQTK